MVARNYGDHAPERLGHVSQWVLAFRLSVNQRILLPSNNPIPDHDIVLCLNAINVGGRDKVEADKYKKPGTATYPICIFIFSINVQEQLLRIPVE